MHMCVYKSFSAILDRGLRKNNKKSDGEIWKHKWNGSTEYEIEKLKLDKNLKKKSSYSPVVFKHGCSLDSYLEL